jgi:adenosine/AMP kinase|tara:strand:- start:1352 stop:1606 length:255 start_codon:yes stop_codon:yes gene_type:complete
MLSRLGPFPSSLSSLAFARITRVTLALRVRRVVPGRVSLCPPIAAAANARVVAMTRDRRGLDGGVDTNDDRRVTSARDVRERRP